MSDSPDTPFFFEATRYWSEGDEQAHFDWLHRIGCIRNVRGQGTRVFLAIELEDVSPADRIELEAVYRRYEGDLDQLRLLGESVHAQD